LTQKDLIFSFLLKNPNARPIEISKALKIPGPSTRRAIFNLRKQKILSRPVISGKNQGTVKIRKTREARVFQKLLKKIKPKRKPEPKIEIFWKKTLGLTLYCNRQETNFKAIIIEKSKFPDRENKLRAALFDHTIDDCGDIEKANLGYEVEEYELEEDDELGVITFEKDD
tara:strand:- start:417 stop:926 length:510 start_codon:yes stop_codon:yes gene_type:complete